MGTMTLKEREAWEDGVAQCGALLVQRMTHAQRDGAEALVMGMLHGTMGMGPPRKKEPAT